jgi:hypothetical protein
MAEFHRRIPGLSHRRLIRLALGAALLLVLPALPAAAQSDAGAAAHAVRPLGPLPKAPSVELAPPEPGDVEQLDALLARIRSEDASAREDARREILEVGPRLVSAIDRRMNAIADKANRDSMKQALEGIRKRARDDERDKLRAAGEKGKVTTPDYLEMVSRDARPSAKEWQDLVSVLAMSRMLVQIGTVEAARELIDVYVRFGEFLRVDTQLMLEKMNEKAIAALIETRRHRAEKIARWAERQLDTLGKGIPGEAVQTQDQQVLADVLRAYGRTRDPDAARIVISFANSERAQVRDAARQAVALLGEIGAWQLRDTYESIVGKKPQRDWSWERTARELFGEFDRLRFAQVYEQFDRGQKAQNAGDTLAMKQAFDKVLTRNPNFDRRSEMAPGYVKFATDRADTDRAAALDALRRARRIAESDDQKKIAESLLLTLEAEQLLDRGVADQLLLRRAIELDASNQRARDVLARMERGETHGSRDLGRYASAIAIALVALAAILLIAIRRIRPSKAGAPAPETGKS